VLNYDLALVVAELSAILGFFIKKLSTYLGAMMTPGGRNWQLFIVLQLSYRLQLLSSFSTCVYGHFNAYVMMP